LWGRKPGKERKDEQQKRFLAQALVKKAGVQFKE